jgi:hypothetical protein
MFTISFALLRQMSDESHSLHEKRPMAGHDAARPASLASHTIS